MIKPVRAQYPFNTPSNIPRIETPDTLPDPVRWARLLTPPPTYQGLKLDVSVRIAAMVDPFNTPSNIPRIETMANKKVRIVSALLTPPPTYQGLKLDKPANLKRDEKSFNTPSNIPRIETILQKESLWPLEPFNTPSNIPRIETSLYPLPHCQSDRLLTPPPTYQGLKPLLFHVLIAHPGLLTPPPTYQGLKPSKDFSRAWR